MTQHFFKILSWTLIFLYSDSALFQDFRPMTSTVNGLLRNYKVYLTSMWSLWSACVRWTVANLWSESLFIHTGSDAFQPADRPHCLYRYVVSMFGHPSCVNQDQLVQIAPFYLWSIQGTKVSGQCRFVLTQNLFHCLWLVRKKRYLVTTCFESCP